MSYDYPTLLYNGNINTSGVRQNRRLLGLLKMAQRPQRQDPHLYDDLIDYQKAMVALKETIQLMAEIDEQIPGPGGVISIEHNQ